jgi:hypothetical protein
MTTIARTFLAVALAGLLAAPSGFAQYPPTGQSRDLAALQDDLNRIDASFESLNARQRARFQTRLDELREDVTWLKVELRRAETRGSRPSPDPADVAELREKAATLRADIELAQGRRLTSTPVRVPAGTEIDVTLEQRLSSRTARVEERVEAVVAEPVVFGGRTVIPAGTTVTGYVSDVQGAERAARDGRLRLDFETMTLPDGSRANIRSRVISVNESRSGTSTAKKAGLGAILGGVLGGVVSGTKGAVVGAVVGAGGAVVATRGQDVELPEGTLVRLRLDAPVAVARRSSY